MKKFYDKLLLALAVLALLGGGLFYVMNSDGATDQSTSMHAQFADNPYQPVSIPDPVSSQASWPVPGPQSSGPKWLYDVFTPPKIYLDADGNFTPVPTVLPEEEIPEPFGIYLAEMERKPYRIQMQGFSVNREKTEEAVLFFYDEDRQLRFFIKEGQTNEESDVEVLDFTIKREIDAEKGEVEITAIARILDKRSGEEIELNDDERLLSSDVALVFLSNEDPGVRVELTVELGNPVSTFETSAGKYVLKEINLDDLSVTVEKQATEEGDATTRTLFLNSLNQPELNNSNEESEEPSFQWGSRF